MANNCNVLMKEAFDNYLGIDMRYKLDDTLAALGKQKLNATQLEGYLLKQGVSPKEIKQAGILENFRGDSRALSGEDWLRMSGRQKITTEDPGLDLYSDITLDGKGADNPTYTELLSTVKAPKNNVPYEPHFNVNKNTEGEQSLLGWRRTHVQDIDGKKTLVLNEIQSDWAQTERAKRGIFESSTNSPKLQEQFKEARATIEKYKLEFFDNLRQQEQNKNLPLQDIEDKYWDDWVEYTTTTGPEELIHADAIAGGKVNLDIVADFPMAEIKQHQFQIVGAIDDALKQGIDTIAIPIKREGDDLKGNKGVTKFYESLNQKVLPDIRKRLEKQGMRIKVDKTPYMEASMSRDIADRVIKENYNKLSAEAKADLSLDDLMSKPSYNDKIQALIHIADSYGGTTFNEEFKKLASNPTTELLFSKRYLNGLILTSDKEAPAILEDMIAQPWFKKFEQSEFYPYKIPMNELLENQTSPASALEDIVMGLLVAGKGRATNELWKLTVEEIPNKPVKWDVYGLIGALGLSSMLAGEANAEELKPGQVSISPKTNQQTQQQPRPIMEQMTTQPEVIEQPRQQMDKGFSLRKLLESDKLAPEVDEQSTASLFEQLGLVKKDDLGNYRVNKDIDEDSRVDMRKQMPKTIQDQEGEYLTTHRPTKKSGWTIGRGYDSTGRKLQDIINDFAKAGISQQKAIAFFKHKPISINSKQSKALGDIAWQEKVKVAKSIGLPMEELDKEGFLKVMSLVYRGDIVKGGKGYRGRLYNYAKNGNIKAIDRFINTEARNMEGGSVLYNRWKKFNKEI